MPGKTLMAEQDTIKSIGRSVFTLIRTMIVRIGGAAAALFLAVYLGRTMGADDAGRFFVGLNVVLGFSFLTRLGLDTALIKLTGPAWERGDRSYMRGLLLQSMLISGVLSLALAVIGYIIVQSSIIRLDDAGLVATLKNCLIALPPFSVALVLAGLLKGMRKPELAGLLERSGLPVVTLIFAMSLSAVFRQIDAAIVMLAYAIGALGLVVLGVSVAWRNTSTSDAVCYERWSIIKAAALPLVVSGLAGFFINWWSGIAIAWFASPEDVGILGAAQRVANTFMLVLVAFNSVFAPRFPGLYQRGDLVALERLARRSTRMMLAVTALPFIVCIIFRSEVMSVFGTEFTQGGLCMAILCIGQLINIATGSVGFLLNMTGHETITRQIVLVISSITLVLGTVVIALFGVLGAAIVTAAGIAAQNLWMAYVVQSKLGISTRPW